MELVLRGFLRCQKACRHKLGVELPVHECEDEEEEETYHEEGGTEAYRCHNGAVELAGNHR